MPFFPKRRPLVTVLTDAGRGVGEFCWKKLPWIALTTALPGLPAFGLWMKNGAKLPAEGIDPMYVIFGIGFVVVLVFAALLLALRDRGTEAGVAWTYEERPLCEERAAEFVRLLLDGKRRLAFERVSDEMQERIRFPAFDEEWKAFEFAGIDGGVLTSRELRGPDDWRASPFARYGARSLRPLAIVDLEYRFASPLKTRTGRLRMHLASRRDDWVVLGWERSVGSKGAGDA